MKNLTDQEKTLIELMQQYGSERNVFFDINNKEKEVEFSIINTDETVSKSNVIVTVNGEENLHSFNHNPGLIDPDGNKYWFKNGKLTNNLRGKPSIVFRNGSTRHETNENDGTYYISTWFPKAHVWALERFNADNQRHSADKPAIDLITPFGFSIIQHYYVDGIFKGLKDKILIPETLKEPKKSFLTSIIEKINTPLNQKENMATEESRPQRKM